MKKLLNLLSVTTLMTCISATTISCGGNSNKPSSNTLNNYLNGTILVQQNLEKSLENDFSNVDKSIINTTVLNNIKSNNIIISGYAVDANNSKNGSINNNNISTFSLKTGETIHLDVTLNKAIGKVASGKYSGNLKVNSFNILSINNDIHDFGYFDNSSKTITLIMNSDDFSFSASESEHSPYAQKKYNGNNWLYNYLMSCKGLQIDTSTKTIMKNISDTQWWNDVFNPIKKADKFIMVNDGYLACMKLQIESDNSIKLIYSNLTSGYNNGKTNLPVDPKTTTPANISIGNCEIPNLNNDTNNEQLLLNEDLLQKLKTTKDLNYDNVSNLLSQNKFIYTNSIQDKSTLINDLINYIKLK